MSNTTLKLSPFSFNHGDAPPCECTPPRSRHRDHADTCPAGDVTVWVPLPPVVVLGKLEAHISWVSGVHLATVVDLRSEAAGVAEEDLGDGAYRKAKAFIWRFREALTGTLACRCIAEGSTCAGCHLRKELHVMAGAVVAMRRAQRAEYAAFLSLPDTKRARDCARNGELRMGSPDLREVNDIPSAIAARFVERALAVAKELVR